VISANLNRRHLTTSDRSLIAARLATLGQGAPQRDQKGHLRIAEAAEQLKVSPNSVKRAREVLQRSTPELLAEVAAHELIVSKAEHLLPPKPPRVVAAGGYTIEARRALSDEERTALLPLRTEATANRR
jgi:hypothetical protein